MLRTIGGTDGGTKLFKEVLEVLKSNAGFFIGLIYFSSQLQLPDGHAQRPIAFGGERKKLAIMVIRLGKVIHM